MSVVESSYDSQYVHTKSMHTIYNHLANNYSKCENFNIEIKHYNFNKEDIHNILYDKNIFNFNKMRNYKEFKKNNSTLAYLEQYSTRERDLAINTIINLFETEEESNIREKLKEIAKFYEKLEELDFTTAKIEPGKQYVDLSLKETENYLSDGEVFSSDIEENSIFNFSDDKLLHIKLKNPTFILTKNDEYDFFTDEKSTCYLAHIYTTTPEFNLISEITQETLFENRSNELQEFVDDENYKRFEEKYHLIRKDTIHLLKEYKSMIHFMKELHYEDLLENLDNTDVVLDKDCENLMKRVMTSNKLDKEMLNKSKQYRIDKNNKQ